VSRREAMQCLPWWGWEPKSAESGTSHSETPVAVSPWRSGSPREAPPASRAPPVRANPPVSSRRARWRPVCHPPRRALARAPAEWAMVDSAASWTDCCGFLSAGRLEANCGRNWRPLGRHRGEGCRDSGPDVIRKTRLRGLNQFG